MIWLKDIYKLRKYIINKPGIYCIKNNKSGKIYVGSSINLYYRIKDHKVRLLENKHSNDHLQKSFNNSGIEYFTIKILKFTILPEKNILEKYEQYYIDLLNPEYNILKEAYKNSSYKHTPEIIEKIRKSGIGRKTNNRIILQYDKYNNVIKEWPSIIEIKNVLKINHTNICKVCMFYESNGERYKYYHSAHNFIWKYKIERKGSSN